MHFLLLFGIVLLPKAYSLKCYDCQAIPGGPPCVQTEKECLPNQKCSVTKVSTYVATTNVQVDMKGCVMTEQCLQGSVNFGVTRTTYASKCCTTDLCNTMDVAAYSKNAPNGKKCYYCDKDNCGATTECKGDEDRCFSLSAMGNGVSVTMKGCATKNVCSQSSAMAGTPGAEFECCEGDLCNSASSTRVGLLLLMTSLISVYMIS